MPHFRGATDYNGARDYDPAIGRYEEETTTNRGLTIPVF
jgi:hypothetical protein